MDLRSNRERALIDADSGLFMKAVEAFHAMGRGNVLCDVCSTCIRFERFGASMRHVCKCGNSRERCAVSDY